MNGRDPENQTRLSNGISVSVTDTREQRRDAHGFRIVVVLLVVTASIGSPLAFSLGRGGGTVFGLRIGSPVLRLFFLFLVASTITIAAVEQKPGKNEPQRRSTYMP